MRPPTSPSTAEIHRDLLADLRARRLEKGMSLNALAAVTGASAVFIGAALAGQAQLTRPTATKLAEALAIDDSDLEPLCEPPLRSCDPLVYRLHELIDVYGEAIREWTVETFGDGILSAIDLTIAVERRGERAVITLDSKFLPYREF